jgi:acyl-[acyl-carrier-protein]-phospholipid O-acyltransferase/long-chain-fatty-acid--[acyl-carrier-protein] ligase
VHGFPLDPVPRALPGRAQGRREPRQRGHNPIIALNHTSFLDAALALSLLPKDPVFAIDSAMAQHWWVKPFLRFTRGHAARSDQADGDAHLDQRGEKRRAADHLPGGPLTVTGSLMKIYDGAG